MGLRTPVTPPLPDCSYHEFDAGYESDHFLDLGGAKGEAPICLKQMEFS
jgi:hypothetical protein